VLLTAGDYWLMAVYDGPASVGQNDNGTTMLKYISYPFGNVPPATFPAQSMYRASSFNYYIVVSR